MSRRTPRPHEEEHSDGPHQQLQQQLQQFDAQPQSSALDDHLLSSTSPQHAAGSPAELGTPSPLSGPACKANPQIDISVHDPSRFHELPWRYGNAGTTRWASSLRFYESRSPSKFDGATSPPPPLQRRPPWSSPTRVDCPWSSPGHGQMSQEAMPGAHRDWQRTLRATSPGWEPAREGSPEAASRWSPSLPRQRRISSPLPARGLFQHESPSLSAASQTGAGAAKRQEAATELGQTAEAVEVQEPASEADPSEEDGNNTDHGPVWANYEQRRTVGRDSKQSWPGDIRQMLEEVKLQRERQRCNEVLAEDANRDPATPSMPSRAAVSTAEHCQESGAPEGKVWAEFKRRRHADRQRQRKGIHQMLAEVKLKREGHDEAVMNRLCSDESPSEDASCGAVTERSWTDAAGHVAAVESTPATQESPDRRDDVWAEFQRRKKADRELRRSGQKVGGVQQMLEEMKQKRKAQESGALFGSVACLDALSEEQEPQPEPCNESISSPPPLCRRSARDGVSAKSNCDGDFAGDDSMREAVATHPSHPTSVPTLPGLSLTAEALPGLPLTAEAAAMMKLPGVLEAIQSALVELSRSSQACHSSAEQGVLLEHFRQQLTTAFAGVVLSKPFIDAESSVTSIHGGANSRLAADANCSSAEEHVLELVQDSAFSRSITAGSVAEAMAVAGKDEAEASAAPPPAAAPPGLTAAQTQVVRAINAALMESRISVQQGIASTKQFEENVEESPAPVRLGRLRGSARPGIGESGAPGRPSASGVQSAPGEAGVPYGSFADGAGQAQVLAAANASSGGGLRNLEHGSLMFTNGEDSSNTASVERATLQIVSERLGASGGQGGFGRSGGSGGLAGPGIEGSLSGCPPSTKADAGEPGASGGYHGDGVNQWPVQLLSANGDISSDMPSAATGGTNQGVPGGLRAPHGPGRPRGSGSPGAARGSGGKGASRERYEPSRLDENGASVTFERLGASGGHEGLGRSGGSGGPGGPGTEGSLSGCSPSMTDGPEAGASGGYSGDGVNQWPVQLLSANGDISSDMASAATGGANQPVPGGLGAPHGPGRPGGSGAPYRAKGSSGKGESRKQHESSRSDEDGASGALERRGASGGQEGFGCSVGSGGPGGPGIQGNLSGCSPSTTDSPGEPDASGSYNADGVNQWPVQLLSANGDSFSDMACAATGGTNQGVPGGLGAPHGPGRPRGSGSPGAAKGSGGKDASRKQCESSRSDEDGASGVLERRGVSGGQEGFGRSGGSGGPGGSGSEGGLSGCSPSMTDSPGEPELGPGSANGSDEASLLDGSGKIGLPSGLDEQDLSGTPDKPGKPSAAGTSGKSLKERSEEMKTWLGIEVGKNEDVDLDGNVVFANGQDFDSKACGPARAALQDATGMADVLNGTGTIQSNCMSAEPSRSTGRLEAVEVFSFDEGDVEHAACLGSHGSLQSDPEKPKGPPGKDRVEVNASLGHACQAWLQHCGPSVASHDANDAAETHPTGRAVGSLSLPLHRRVAPLDKSGVGSNYMDFGLAVHSSAAAYAEELNGTSPHTPEQSPAERLAAAFSSTLREADEIDAGARLMLAVQDASEDSSELAKAVPNDMARDSGPGVEQSTTADFFGSTSDVASGDDFNVDGADLIRSGGTVIWRGNMPGIDKGFENGREDVCVTSGCDLNGSAEMIGGGSLMLSGGEGSGTITDGAAKMAFTSTPTFIRRGRLVAHGISPDRSLDPVPIGGDGSGMQSTSLAYLGGDGVAPADVTASGEGEQQNDVYHSFDSAACKDVKEGQGAKSYESEQCASLDCSGFANSSVLDASGEGFGKDLETSSMAFTATVTAAFGREDDDTVASAAAECASEGKAGDALKILSEKAMASSEVTEKSPKSQQRRSPRTPRRVLADSAHVAAGISGTACGTEKSPKSQQSRSPRSPRRVLVDGAHVAAGISVTVTACGTEKSPRSQQSRSPRSPRRVLADGADLAAGISGTASGTLKSPKTQQSRSPQSPRRVFADGAHVEVGISGTTCGKGKGGGQGNGTSADKGKSIVEFTSSDLPVKKNIDLGFDGVSPIVAVSEPMSSPTFGFGAAGSAASGGKVAGAPEEFPAFGEPHPKGGAGDTSDKGVSKKSGKLPQSLASCNADDDAVLNALANPSRPLGGRSLSPSFAAPEFPSVSPGLSASPGLSSSPGRPESPELPESPSWPDIAESFSGKGLRSNSLKTPKFATASSADDEPFSPDELGSPQSPGGRRSRQASSVGLHRERSNGSDVDHSMQSSATLTDQSASTSVLESPAATDACSSGTDCCTAQDDQIQELTQVLSAAGISNSALSGIGQAPSVMFGGPSVMFGGAPASFTPFDAGKGHGKGKGMSLLAMMPPPMLKSKANSNDLQATTAGSEPIMPPIPGSAGVKGGGAHAPSGDGKAGGMGLGLGDGNGSEKKDLPKQDPSPPPPPKEPEKQPEKEKEKEPEKEEPAKGKGPAKAKGKGKAPPAAPKPKAPDPTAKGKGKGKDTAKKEHKISKLKPFGWHKIQAEEGSLWATYGSSGVEFPRSLIEAIFPWGSAGGTQQKKNQAQEEAAKSLTIPARCMGICIGLNPVRNLTLQQLREAMLSLDDNILTPEVSESLLMVDPKSRRPIVLPTPEEIASAKEYVESGQAFEALDDASKYLASVYDVPHLHDRLLLQQFRFGFDKRRQHLRRQIEIIVEALQQVQGSQRFAQILITVLKMGNVLNDGTARGDAAGFRITSLSQLSQLKQVDGPAVVPEEGGAPKPRPSVGVAGLSLLDLLVQLMEEQKPELMSVEEDMPQVREAARVDLSEVSQDLNLLRNDLNRIARSSGSAASEANEVKGDMFPTMGPAFVSSAEGQLGDLDEGLKEAQQVYSDVLAFFGEKKGTGGSDSLPPHEWLSYIKAFLEELERSVTGHRSRTEKIHRKARRLGGLRRAKTFCVKEGGDLETAAADKKCEEPMTRMRSNTHYEQDMQPQFSPSPSESSCPTTPRRRPRKSDVLGTSPSKARGSGARLQNAGSSETQSEPRPPLSRLMSAPLLETGT